MSFVATGPEFGSVLICGVWCPKLRREVSEITGSFLISIGFLPGAHDETCPVYGRILKLRPARWQV